MHFSVVLERRHRFEYCAVLAKLARNNARGHSAQTPEEMFKPALKLRAVPWAPTVELTAELIYDASASEQTAAS